MLIEVEINDEYIKVASAIIASRGYEGVSAVQVIEAAINAAMGRDYLFASTYGPTMDRYLVEKYQVQIVKVKGVAL